MIFYYKILTKKNIGRRYDGNVTMMPYGNLSGSVYSRS